MKINGFFPLEALSLLSAKLSLRSGLTSWNGFFHWNAQMLRVNMHPKGFRPFAFLMIIVYDLPLDSYVKDHCEVLSSCVMSV